MCGTIFKFQVEKIKTRCIHLEPVLLVTYYTHTRKEKDFKNYRNHREINILLWKIHQTRTCKEQFEIIQYKKENLHVKTELDHHNPQVILAVYTFFQDYNLKHVIAMASPFEILSSSNPGT